MRKAWGILLLLLCAGAFLSWRLIGAPGADEWTIPLRTPWNHVLHLKAAPLLKISTAAMGRRMLDGSHWRTESGTWALSDHGGALLARCAPCAPRLATLSADPLPLSSVTLVLRRDNDEITGQLIVAEKEKVLPVTFSGNLGAQSSRFHWDMPRTDLTNVFGVLRAWVPEADRARILGRISATGTFSLPDGKWSASPLIEGFEVYGLGTERLRYGHFDFVCRDQDGLPSLRPSGDGAPGWLTLAQMGRTLPRTVLATEDSRFFEHPGYDPGALMPILANAERSGKRGASTLSQQLAKNFFIGAEHSGARKLRELLYAVEMERTLGKRRILALYLNTVDWGPAICGAEDAARRYFGRAPDRLNPVQAAWLAGILRNPQRAYRQEFLARAPETRRLSWVLAQMPRTSRHELEWIPGH